MTTASKARVRIDPVSNRTMAVKMDSVSMMTPLPKHGVVTVPRRSASGMPTVIPGTQLYYWSARWQADEAASRADIEAGRVRVFDNPAAVFDYLLDADDTPA